MIDTNTTSTPAATKTNLWQTLRKRWLLIGIVSMAVFGASAISTFRKIPKYQSETLILINNNNSISVLSGTGGTSESIVYEDLSTEIQVLKSRALVSQALSQMRAPYENIPADMVVGNLYIGQPNKTGILIVSYADTDRARTKAVLDALGKTYVKYSSERKRSRATNAIKLIEEQLPQANKSLNESSQALKIFRQQYGLLDPESYGASLLQRQRGLEEEARVARSTLEQTQRQYQELLRQLGQVSQEPTTAISDSILSQDTAYQSLVGQLQDLDSQIAQERIRFQDNHPRIENLKIRRGQILKALQNQIRQVLGKKSSEFIAKNRRPLSGNTQQNLAGQLLQLQTSLAIESTVLKNVVQSQAEVTNRFQQVPFLQQQYIQLQEEFKRNTETVNNFLNRLQELRIAEAQDVSSWQILEPAYLPGAPISPDYKKDLTMGLAVGVLLGFGSAVLLERRDKTIKTVDTVKQLTGMPLIGVIPKLSQKAKARQNLAVEAPPHQRSSFVESLRSLAITLRFWDSNRNLQTIAFTSALPKEGKTTVTYNLGLVLADLGQRILIIDSDLHEPTIHKLIHESNEFGLSTVLETNRPWRDSIHYDVNRQKLDVMTSGPAAENPVSLLLSDKMKQLLSEWKEAYDYVLIDTPAILNFTEAQSLASRVDGLVLVVGLERCTPVAIARALEILQGNEYEPIGTVVNFLGKDDQKQYHFSTSKPNYDKLIRNPLTAARDN